MYSNFIHTGVRMLHDMSDRNKEWEGRIIAEWKSTFKMPRKKKKRERKKINFDYNLCKYAQKELGLDLFE